MPNLTPDQLRRHRTIAERIKRPPDPLTPKMFWATVTAIASGPASLTLLISGSSTPIPNIRYAASYTPTVADVVFGLSIGPDFVVLGKIAT